MIQACSCGAYWNLYSIGPTSAVAESELTRLWRRYHSGEGHRPVEPKVAAYNRAADIRARKQREEKGRR